MHMMPLAMATKGEEQLIKKVGGKEEINVKDSRVAIGKEMALKIMV